MKLHFSLNLVILLNVITYVYVGSNYEDDHYL